jgi:hypothetical protein
LGKREKYTQSSSQIVLKQILDFLQSLQQLFLAKEDFLNLHEFHPSQPEDVKTNFISVKIVMI